MSGAPRIRTPQVVYLADGARLHLQDGPIDLVVQAYGSEKDVRLAYEAAVQAATGLLDTLCDELPELRRPADPFETPLRGVVARRMYAAVAPFAARQFITPMASVAGAVAEEILGAMTGAASLDRAYVNNGGDIALYLTPGTRFTAGLVARPDAPALIGTAVVEAHHRSRGIATSGRHGRSFSLGIADAVTVLAKTAAQADAAATVIANAVDLPGHRSIQRVAACDLQPDSDLGHRLVTRDVGYLSAREIQTALDAGRQVAETLIEKGLIDASALHLKGETSAVDLDASVFAMTPSPQLAGHRKTSSQKESLMHA